MSPMIMPKFFAKTCENIYVVEFNLDPMNNPKVGSKRKRGRGKAYDIDKIMELYDQGYKYKEIADELNIKSMQSLRNAVGKILRKRKKWYSRSQKNKLRENQSIEAETRMGFERKEQERELVDTDILEIRGDNETIMNLEDLWDNMGLPHDKVGRVYMFYIPYPFEHLVGDYFAGLYWWGLGNFRAEGKFHSKDLVDNLREFLHMLGFFTTVESGDPKGSLIFIFQSHSFGTNEFNKDIIINGIFHKKWNGFV